MASIAECFSAPDVLRSSMNNDAKIDAGVMFTAYGTFIMTVLIVAYHLSDQDFSVTLTASSGVQCFGFLMLGRKVKATNSVAGISSKSLEMYAIVLFLRLCSTMVKNGYLPVDRTGDIIYQCGDIASLCLVVRLLYKIHRQMKSTYQSEHDTLSLGPAILPAIVLALCCHGHLNNSFVFDSIWFLSLYLETVAMLPQLWMFSKIGGEVEGMTSHFVFCLFAAKSCACLFWYHGYPELADGYVDANDDGIPENWGTNNYGGYMIIICYSLQLLGSADFIFHYLQAFLARRRMMLPELEV